VNPPLAAPSLASNTPPPFPRVAAFHSHAMLHSLLLSLVVLAPPAPPATRVEPVTETLHGEAVVDNYRWLEKLESESEEVKTWTTAQLEYTAAVLGGLPCRKALEERLASLMTVGSVSAPVTRGTRYFYTERKGTANQPMLLMRESHNGEPFTLLDVSALDAKGLYSLDWWYPNKSGSHIAFGLSYAGSEMTTLHVLSVDDTQWLSDEIPGKISFGGWTPDGTGFLYSQLERPEDAYSRTVRFHTLGRHHRTDSVLSRQTIPSRIPFANLSDDGRWILMGLTDGWARNDLSVIDVAEWRRSGELAPVAIADGLNGRFTPAVVAGDTAYVLTTFESPNGRLLAIDLTNPNREGWKTLIKERPDAVLTGVDHARGRLIVEYEKDATTRMEQFRFDGTPLGEVKLPGLGTAAIATNEDRTEAFISYTSFNEPTSVYRIDLADGERTLWARPDVPVDPSTVEVHQEFCTSKDGTRIPMFIVHRSGLARNGANPTLVYGYGGFNASMTPSFNPARFAWFEQGGVYVQVTLRGGGEYGEAWHQAGMLGNKQNVFDDLYAATEHLIKAGYTAPANLAVLGGSNGGLLTGVAATQRPDLYAAVVSAVPLLDMLRYQNFLMARFWVPEYGSAEDAAQFKWLRAYSPYHNVKPGTKFPAVLFTAGENDSRVHPLHARKMAALMQAVAGNDLSEDPILLWVDREAGHGQGKPLAARVKEAADLYSFLFWQTGICE